MESARKLIFKPESSDEANNLTGDTKNESPTTTPSIGNPKRPEVTRRSFKVHSTAKSPDERKPPKFPKRFGSSKSASVEVFTPGRDERKSNRFNKFRKVEEKIGTTSIGNDDENDLVESSTLPYSKDRQEETTEDPLIRKTMPTKSRVLSRRAKELPREHTTTKRTRAWIAQHIDKNFQEPKTTTDSSTRRSTTTKRTRVWNTAYIDRNWQEPTRKSMKNEGSSTTEMIGSSETTESSREGQVIDLSSRSSPVSRYNRKKTAVFKPFDPVPKVGTTTEQSAQSSRRREFRPRTATYRRHSELPGVMIVNAISAEPSSLPSTTSGGITITPKTPTRFHATVRGSSSTQRSARQEPTVNVKISSDNGNAIPNSNASSGIVGISNGDSGNSANSNIFSPTRSTFLLNSNSTLLQQLRSTVAPLLGALGNKTPIFATAYTDVTNNTVRL